MPCSKTPWMFKDNIAIWTWPGYERKPAAVDVYADADEVELFLNGHSLGRKPAGEKHGFTATYEMIYEPGELTAVSYEDGKETGRFSLETADSKVQLFAETDRKTLSADGEDLAFITVKLVDENGIENLFASKNVTASVKGAGKLQAFGSADPKALESYDDTTWQTYDGYVMAVIRAGREAGTVTVTFTTEGCKEQCVEVEVI